VTYGSYLTSPYFRRQTASGTIRNWIRASCILGGVGNSISPPIVVLSVRHLTSSQMSTAIVPSQAASDTSLNQSHAPYRPGASFDATLPLTVMQMRQLTSGSHKVKLLFSSQALSGTNVEPDHALSKSGAVPLGNPLPIMAVRMTPELYPATSGTDVDPGHSPRMPEARYIETSQPVTTSEITKLTTGSCLRMTKKPQLSSSGLIEA
jgi:hypothetical protein